MSKRVKVDEVAIGRVLPTDYTDRMVNTVQPAANKAKRQIYYLNEDLVRRVKILAQRQGISGSDVAKLALAAYLKDQGV